MLGQEDKDGLAAGGGGGGGGARKAYLRSISWTDRSPTKTIPRPQQSSKARSCLPPLQPLSITRRPVEEWPRAGSDDLGVWPHPQTPRGAITPRENSNLEQAVKEFQFKKDKLAFFDRECSRIDDHIYLGSDAVAKNRELLRQNGITHVLNCVGFVCPEYFKSDLVYKTLWLQDSPSEDITSILYDVFDYFEDVREQGGRVLVHCCQGVSRSTSLVIAYRMWREGQSFEDAFQYVKTARGVTNPNMGFACQLLQCQKRVHVMPASPNSMVRMYRMAPHSSYDPLHLVPKMLSNPTAQGLDSRGAFIVHVPSAIYVWIGKYCNSVMSNQAGVAANQVVRYERAQGPIVSIKEGEEPSEFWDTLSGGQLVTDSCNKVEVKNKEACVAAIHVGVGGRKACEYDMDFELFDKALAGGVVPPFSASSTGSETCLPARENGWGKLRQKFANGRMKELLTSSKLDCDTVPPGDGSDMSPKLNCEAITSSDRCNMIVGTNKESELPMSFADCSSPLSASAHSGGSQDSFEYLLEGSPNRIYDNCKEVENSRPLSDPPLSPAPTCGSPDSFSCFLGSSPKLSSKSPTLSPSTSDYASSFTFSPSSSNWSDLSYLSSQQPSPSGLENTDPVSVQMADNPYLVSKETPLSPKKSFSANHALRLANTYLPCKGTLPSIAERRGSNPPPLMLLSSVDESSQLPRNLARSWSFSLSDSIDEVMKDVDCEHLVCESNGEELMVEANIINTCNDPSSEIENNKVHCTVHLPSNDMVDKAREMTTLDFPVDAHMQIGGAEQELEQFLNHRNCFSFQNVGDCSHG